MRFKIHPAIGIARVGNSDEVYLAPEKTGGLPLLRNGGRFQAADFRDGQNKMRRQAVRFQVFDYLSGTGVPVKPGKGKGKGKVKSIRWTVHVANKKASWYAFIANESENGYAPNHPLRNSSKKNRLALIIDAGPRTLEGPGKHASFSRNSSISYKMKFPMGPLHPPERPIDSLGDMWTDEACRMIFAGGYGISGSSINPPVIGHFANNDDWWDDTSDGPVRAEVIMDDDTAEEALSAWVTVAPPRYAPQLVSLVTLYDVIYDIGVRFQGLNTDIFTNGMWNPKFEPRWEEHILPILERAQQYQWVVAIPPKPHTFDWKRLGNRKSAFNAYRKYYVDQVRAPDQTNLFASPITGMPMMPYLCGDNCIAPNFTAANYQTLTRTQYFYLSQWAKGNFTQEPADKLSYAERLDRAALENCSGGAFSPGIEISWICRNPDIYESAFRIRLKKRKANAPLTSGSNLREGLEPGDLSKYQALPWQADFNECSYEPLNDRFLWWWPVQRPTFVRTEQRKQVAWIGTMDDQNADDYVQFAQDLEMVGEWSNLGFLFNRGTRSKPRFVEMNRIPPR